MKRVVMGVGWVALVGLGSSLVAAEMGPKPIGRQASSAFQEPARVIVKFRAGSAAMRTQALALKAPAAGPQQAKALGRSLGLSLQDGRPLNARTQVLWSRELPLASLMTRLAQHPDVEWVVEDKRRFATATPNDPYFAGSQPSITPTVGQWYLRAPAGEVVSAINAQGAWDRTQGSANVIVAVLDTGVRPEHPDLSGKLVAGYDFVGYSAPASGYSVADAISYANDGDQTDADPSDPGDWVTAAEAASTRYSGCDASDSSWHGTKVSGLIGANTHNAIGMAGVGWATRVLPVRVLGKCGGFDSEIIAGMRWASGLSVSGVSTNPNKAQVLNLSLGGSGACSAAYTDAVREITAAGVSIVVAAGNDGLAVGSPANCSGVIAVAGIRHAGTKVGYSSLGPEVTVAAPAGNCVNTSGACLYPLLTTDNSGSTGPLQSTYSDSYNYSVGTSFATPLVAGTVALMKAANPNLTPAQVIQTLRSTARTFPTTGADAGVGTCQAPSSVAQVSECYCTTSTCGAGMLDASSAVAAVAGPVARISASATAVVAGNSLSLDGAGSSTSTGRQITGYAWSITSGGSLASFSGATNAAQASLSTSAAGTVTLQLTVTDDTGATAQTTQQITVQAKPVDPAPTPSGGGGGGSLTAAYLALLLAGGMLMRRRQTRQLRTVPATARRPRD